MKTSPVASAVKAYKIGDVGPARGTVFSVESGTYLEAAPNDIGVFDWKKAMFMAGAYSKTVNGITYNDWYLPSRDELNAMYENRKLIGGFSTDLYWSSSEYDAKYAWYQSFNSGFQDNNFKNPAYYVRPVRAFTI